MAKSGKTGDGSKAAKRGGARTRRGAGSDPKGLVKGAGTTQSIGTGSRGTGSGLARKAGTAKRGRTKGSAMGLKYSRVATGTAADFSTRVVAEKDIRLDAKKRATLTGAEFEHYHMVVTADGTIVLEPRVLAPASISQRTLARMDESMANFAAGNVGDAIDFDRYGALLAEDDE